MVTYITVSEEDLIILAAKDDRAGVINTEPDDPPPEPCALNSQPFVGNHLEDTVYQQIATILQEQQNFYLAPMEIRAILTAAITNYWPVEKSSTPLL